MTRWWAGVDWSEKLQDCAIVDEGGRVVTHLRVEERPAGVAQFVGALRELNLRSHRFSRRQVPVAIEDGRRLFAAELQRLRQPVVVVPPAVVARHRGRLATASSKSDRTDAALLANIVRMNPDRHRTVPETSDQATAIAMMARAQQDAADRSRELMLSLRSHLVLYYPAATEAWATMQYGLRRPEARAVLAQAPTPLAAAALSKRKLAEALAGAGRTRLVDNEAARLRELFAQPRLRQRPATEEAMGARAAVLLADLSQACTHAQLLADRTDDLFSRHPHAAIYRSFPGCGPLIGARLFGEIGDDLERFATARGLCSYAGTAPLTWASGGSRAVTHRKVANRRLKATVHQWAFGTLTRSPGARRLYDDRREKGDGYASALRRVGGRLLSGLHHCLLHGELYSEEAMFGSGEARDGPEAGQS
ncbi:transposase [Kitasatospora sp. NPDC001261]|uniref:IS110 family transposase n=1 Tax=Kitasatospora sp. NPDC001261 TaxID=3364012 RepID=UPI003683DF5D